MIYDRPFIRVDMASLGLNMGESTPRRERAHTQRIR